MANAISYNSNVKLAHENEIYSKIDQSRSVQSISWRTYERTVTSLILSMNLKFLEQNCG